MRLGINWPRVCWFFGHNYHIPVMKPFDPIWCKRCGETIYPIERP